MLETSFEIFRELFSNSSSSIFSEKLRAGERTQGFLAFASIVLITSVWCLRKNNSLPYVTWTKIKLFPIDGLVIALKISKGGIKVLENLFSKHGPVFTLPLGLSEVTAVSDLNIVQRLLDSTNMAHLNKDKEIYNIIFTPALADGLAVADSNKWWPNKKAIAQGMTYKSLEFYLKFIADAVKDLVTNSRSMASQNPTASVSYTDIEKLIDLTLIKIVVEIILGSSSECHVLSENERERFHTALQTCKNLITDRMLNPILLIPPVWRFHPKRREMDKVLKIGQEISYKVIENYKLNLNLKTESDQFSDIGVKPFESIVEKLIKSNTSNEQIVTEICTLLVAGHETLATAIQFQLFLLALNPAHQEICRKEVDEFFESMDELENLSMKDLSKLKYLERCILESLRVYPTAPAFIRRIDDPLDIGGGSKMKAGQSFLISPYIIHRNPEMYPDPEKFDPDRFLAENVKKRHSHSYIPFSMGMRNCVGYKLAIIELKLLFAHILRNFYLTTTDKPEDVNLFLYITLKPERPYNIELKLRDL